MSKILLILAIAALAVSCSEKTEQQTETTVDTHDTTPSVSKVKNERPVMTFTLLDGQQIQAVDIDQPMVLILFQPDCDHCQNEAKQIKNRLDAFNNYQVYFISSQAHEQIKKFGADYKLLNIPNVFFGSTSVQSVLDNFGAIAAPSLYIYSKEGKLVESFEGEVDIGVVLQYL
jgi:peroxiredoxin